jgi:predicted membrane-bound dolichyl-phosphate-mannose-protein mannosyltransferase
VLLVAANPIFLIYAVGEFHNDFFMLVPSMASIALLLGRRYRWAGVAAAVAIAVKYTMVLLLPFLLLAAWQRRASRRLLSGLVIGGIPLAALSVGLFGFTFPNVHGQSRLVTDLSIPNLLGWALGLGGATPHLVSALNVVVVAVVLYQVLRRRDWLSGAGWATLALLVTLGWLMPWYIIWLLPLAAIAPSARLRTVTVLGTVLVTLSFMPVTLPFLKHRGIDPLGSKVGRAAHAFQRHAQRVPEQDPLAPQLLAP